MKKTFFALLGSLALLTAISQSKTDSTKKAILQVHLTNSKQQALDKEEIIISSSNKKRITELLQISKAMVLQLLIQDIFILFNLKPLAIQLLMVK